jgi:hypothetical protein
MAEAPSQELLYLMEHGQFGMDKQLRPG